MILLYIYIGKNGHLPLFGKICIVYYCLWNISNLLPFWNSIMWKSSFQWYLSSWNLSTTKKFWNFLMKLEFMELEHHENFLKVPLDFHKIEFQKGGRFLNILETVVNFKNISKKFQKQWFLAILAYIYIYISIVLML